MLHHHSLNPGSGKLTKPLQNLIDGPHDSILPKVVEERMSAAALALPLHECRNPLIQLVFVGSYEQRGQQREAHVARIAIDGLAGGRDPISSVLCSGRIREGDVVFVRPSGRQGRRARPCPSAQYQGRMGLLKRFRQGGATLQLVVPALERKVILVPTPEAT